MDLRQLIQLKQQGTSNRDAAHLLKIHRNTVNAYVHLFLSTDKTYSELLGLDNTSLQELFPSPELRDQKRYDQLLSFLKQVDQDRHRRGFTFYRKWTEYRDLYPDGYGYTQFMDHFHRLYSMPAPSMKLEHKAGNNVFIDFAGKKLQIVDRHTGEVKPVEVFLALLPCSQYLYVEACQDQSRESLVGCMTHSLSYFGGVPRAIVLDNLKSAVNKSCKYEPAINKTFKELALHYKTVVMPARPYKPQDKALVENAVQLVYQRIYYPLEKMTFFSIEELNLKILELLVSHNNQQLQKRGVSRKELFETIEKQDLNPLPDTPYELRYYRRGKVQKTGHVYFSTDKTYYSVPYRFIGQQLEIQYNASIVELYYNHDRIATHKRNPRPGIYITNKDHLCSTHREYSDWSPDKFIAQAGRIGKHTEEYVAGLIRQYEYPEHAYRQAQGIIHLRRQYPSERIDQACRYAYGIQDRFSYHLVLRILKSGIDQVPMEETKEDQSHIPAHNNIRGESYYQQQLKI